MPVHIYVVHQVQEIRMSKGELASDSLNCLCRQMGRERAGRERTGKEDVVLLEGLRNVNGTISAKKDKPLQSMSQAQFKQQLNDLEQDCDHLQFLKVKGVILVIP